MERQPLCLVHCCAFLFSTPCSTFCPSGKHLHWRKHGCTHSMKRRYKFYDAIHSTLMIVIRIRQALPRLQCNTRFLLMATMMPQVSCFIQCLRKLKDNTRRPWRECPLIPWWVCFFNSFKFGLEPLSVRSFSGRKLQLPIFHCFATVHKHCMPCILIYTLLICTLIGECYIANSSKEYWLHMYSK